MKKIIISVILAFASAFSHMDYDDDILPQNKSFENINTPKGNERLLMLSNLRNALLQSVKNNDFEKIDSTIKDGDLEFSDYPWISDAERVLLYLLTEKYNEILESTNLRKTIWLGNKNSGFAWNLVYPQFCIEINQNSVPLHSGFDYAPDLLSHLNALYKRNKNIILSKMVNVPELKEFLVLAECEDKVFTDRPAYYTKISEPQLDKIKKYIELYPKSKFSSDIKIGPLKFKKLTGNGFSIGAGPRYDWFTEKSNEIISNGINGGFYLEARFPKLVTTTNFEFRSFTSRDETKIEDTTFSKGVSLNLFRFQANLGYPIVVMNKVLLTPYTGLMITALSTIPREEKKYNYSERQSNSFGIPIGINFDFLLYNILPDDFNSSILNCFGVRFNTEYQYGNWSSLEGGLGDHGISVGAMIYWGMFGFE